MSAATCPRCRAPILSLEELADVAMKAEEALARMRLALPTAVSVGVRVLAIGLACPAGKCEPSEGAA